MAIYNQLSLAKKRYNGYLQSTVISQRTLKRLFSQLPLAKIRLNGYLQSEWLLIVFKCGNYVSITFFFLIYYAENMVVYAFLIVCVPFLFGV